MRELQILSTANSIFWSVWLLMDSKLFSEIDDLPKKCKPSVISILAIDTSNAVLFKRLSFFILWLNLTKELEIFLSWLLIASLLFDSATIVSIEEIAYLSSSDNPSSGIPSSSAFIIGVMKSVTFAISWEVRSWVFVAIHALNLLRKSLYWFVVWTCRTMDSRLWKLQERTSPYRLFWYGKVFLCSSAKSGSSVRN